MASIWDERFETATTGYEETWTIGDSLAGGSTLSPIATPADVGRPAFWGTQCCKIVVAGSGDAYRATTTAATANTFYSAEYVITAESLADNNFCIVSFGLNAAVNAYLWQIQLAQVSSVLYSLCYLFSNNGAGVLVDQREWPLNVKRRFELNWNNTANTYEVWVDGVSAGSGSLTGTSATQDFGAFGMGNISTGNAGCTMYTDLQRLDNAARPIDGVGGGAYQQQSYRNLVQE